MLSFAHKAGSVLLGLASRRNRVESARRLLAYSIESMPSDEQKRWLEYAPVLPEDRFASSGLFPSKAAMLKALPKGGRVAEVGVYKGTFSRKIAEVCRPDEFHLIDIDFTPFEPFDYPVTRHQGDSATILRGFAPGYFDWLYIDADHSYAGVKRDLAAAHRALKPGGHLMCNDYSNWCSGSAVPYGVERAVNELILAEGYTVHALRFHPASLHDILIRKPS